MTANRTTDLFSANRRVRREAVSMPIVEGDGCAIVDLPPAAAEIGDNIRLAATAQRTSSSTVSRLLDALADGHLTAAEAVPLEAACDAELAIVLQIRELARAALRERVIATPPLRVVDSGEGRR